MLCLAQTIWLELINVTMCSNEKLNSDLILKVYFYHEQFCFFTILYLMLFNIFKRCIQIISLKSYTTKYTTCFIVTYYLIKVKILIIYRSHYSVSTL